MKSQIGPARRNADAPAAPRQFLRHMASKKA
jgi:hypothetical protein